MIKWCIYYVGGETFSNLDGGPEMAPGINCLGIVQLDDTVDYRVIHGGGPYYGHGFYWWEQDQWFIGNKEGLMQYQCEPGWQKVILGRAVTDVEWRKVLERVEADFGPKASYWYREPRRER